MKAAIPFHRRNNNTSTPPETLTEEEKIAYQGHDSYIPLEDGCNEGMLGKNDGGDEPTPYQQGKGEQSLEQRFQDI